MERGSSWLTHYHYHANLNSWETTLDQGDSELFSDSIEEESKTLVSLDLILPEDLLERILACLPITTIFRVGCVCKRWHEIVSSRSFLWNSDIQSHNNKPWYFMFTSSDYGLGYAYDPTLRKWHGIDLPEFVTSNWYTASSQGLVCFMDGDTRTKIHVCNPITKICKKLMEPLGSKLCDYSSVAISFNRISHLYNVSIVKSKQVPENFHQWELSIHIYDSETLEWTTSVSEVLNGWRAGDESVICDGDLYFMVYSTQVGLQDNNTRHGLVRYNLSSQSSHGLLTRSFIQVPCALTCGRLMNMKEKLVLVGGIGKQDRPDIIKGIGIWVLKGNKWEELARMPHKFLQGFGELDEVFASAGMDELVYIHSYGGPGLVVFDMNNSSSGLKSALSQKSFLFSFLLGFALNQGLKPPPEKKLPLITNNNVVLFFFCIGKN